MNNTLIPERSFFVEFKGNILSLGPDYRAEALEAVLYEAGMYWLVTKSKATKAALLPDYPGLTDEQIRVLEEFYYALPAHETPNFEVAQDWIKLMYSKMAVDWAVIEQPAKLFYQAGEHYFEEFKRDYQHLFEREFDNGFLYVPGLAVVRGLLAIPGFMTEERLKLWADDLLQLGFCVEDIEFISDEPRKVEGVAG